MSDKFDNLPSELREYRQWICWRYEKRDGKKPTKVPYSALGGRRCSVTDPLGFATFEQAVAYARQSDQIAGIGFCFTESDPFCGVDLDVQEGQHPSQRQHEIYEMLDSYSEFSPSGNGLHVIVKAELPAGRNSQKQGIEMYSSGRYFTMTGNVLADKPIARRQEEILETFLSLDDAPLMAGQKQLREIHTGDSVITNSPSDFKPTSPARPISDGILIDEICKSPSRAVHFNWQGNLNWSDSYFAILNAACIYSSDEQQIKRVILAAPLVTEAPPHGKESRFQRVHRRWPNEYPPAARAGEDRRVNGDWYAWQELIGRQGSREEYDKAIEQARISADACLKVMLDKMMLTAKIARQNVMGEEPGELPVTMKCANLRFDKDLDADMPDCMMRDFVKEVCDRTRTPSVAMATWAILSFMSGVAGRLYLLEDGAGVNNFIILVAKTNIGKTQHWNALETVIHNCAPDLMENVVGGDVSSAQIIAKEAQQKPCMLLLVPDGGPWLNGIIKSNNAINQQLRSAILNIYESAGMNARWNTPKSIRAKEDNSKTVEQFNMSIALDTTPQNINSIELSEFEDGFMSRWILVHGPSSVTDLQAPKFDFNFSKRVRENLKGIETLVQNVSKGNRIPGPNERLFCRTSPELKQHMANVEKENHRLIRMIQKDRLPPHYIVASRLPLNTKRIAACVAFMENPANPIITQEIYDWSLRFNMRSVTTVIRQFDSGRMGSEESKQEAAVIDFLRNKIIRTPTQPWTTLSEIGKYIDKLQPFAKARLGARFARQKLLEDMQDRGIIKMQDMATEGRTRKIIFLNPDDDVDNSENNSR